MLEALEEEDDQLEKSPDSCHSSKCCRTDSQRFHGIRDLCHGGGCLPEVRAERAKGDHRCQRGVDGGVLHIVLGVVAVLFDGPVVVIDAELIVLFGAGGPVRRLLTQRE